MNQGENPSNDQTNPGPSEPVVEPVQEPVADENLSVPAAGEMPVLARQLAELETKLAEAQDAFAGQLRGDGFAVQIPAPGTRVTL